MWFVWFGCATPEEEVSPVPSDWETVTWSRPAIGWIERDGGRIWAVGTDGTVYDADRDWRVLADPPFEDDVRAVSSSRGDLWVLGYAQMARLRGHRWEVIPLPADLLLFPQAFVAREDGTVLVTRGEWTEASCTTTTLCPSDSFETTGIYDGSTWVIRTQQVPGRLIAAAETDRGEVVAAGMGGVIATWTGEAWEVARTGPESWNDVATDGDDVVAVGWDGAVIRGPLHARTVEHPSSSPFAAVDAADGWVWAVTLEPDEPFVWVHDGTDWTAVIGSSESAWGAVAALDDGSALVGGDEAGPTAALATPTGIEPAFHLDGFRFPVLAAAMEADGTVWLGGFGAVARWSDALEAWPVPGSWMGAVVGVGGAGDDVVAAVADEGLYRYDGARWSLEWEDPALSLASASIAPDGTGAAIAGDVVGDESVPVFLVRAGGAWAEAALPPGAEVVWSVAAVAAGEVFAVAGLPARLLRWDGATWTNLGDTGGRTVLWGRAGDDVYVGGDDGLLWWDGASLTEVAGAPDGIEEIAGDATGLVVATGDFAVRRYADGAWDLLLQLDAPVHVAGSPGEVVIVGAAEAWRGPLSSW